MESISPIGRGNFEGREGGILQSIGTLGRAAVQKTAEPIEMPFGLWTRVGPRKHVLDGALCTGDMSPIISPCKEAIIRERRCPGMPDDDLP